MSRTRVVLAFRSKAKGGKSIEGLFKTFFVKDSGDVDCEYWEYNPDASFVSNFFSLRAKKADVWHITGDISYMILGLLDKTTLLTIHDIGRYKQLVGWKKWVYGKIWIEWPIRFANLVSVVSNYTKQDIQSLLKIDFRSKIKVIHNAVSPIFCSDHIPHHHGGSIRILQVGTAVHKNLESVIDAVTGMDVTLSIVGPLSLEQTEKLKVSKIKFEHHLDVSDRALKCLYEQSDIVVFASLHEGFGLPIIEAQAMRRPVITSKLTAIPEVAGQGVHYLNDPLNTDEIRQAIEKLIDDRTYRTTIIEEGSKNVERFSLRTMKESYYGAYRKLHGR